MLAAQSQLQRSPQAGSAACAGPRAQPAVCGAARRQLGRRCRRVPRPTAALGLQQLDGPLLGLLELLGYTGDDPGNWNFSPE